MMGYMEYDGEEYIEMVRIRKGMGMGMEIEIEIGNRVEIIR